MVFSKDPGTHPCYSTYHNISLFILYFLFLPNETVALEYVEYVCLFFTPHPPAATMVGKDTGGINE